MNATTETTQQRVELIAIGQIKADPNQPRTQFDKTELRALADDIRARGIIQPITLRPDPATPGDYIIVYGERRYRAAKLAKLPSVRAIIDNAARDDLDRFIDQAAENIQRENLKPMDMARFFNTLHTQHGVKLSEIPQLLKQRGLRRIERPYISNLRRLLDLPDWAQALIDNEQLSPAHGKYMLYARGLDSVLDAMREEIEWRLNNDDDEGRAPTISELIDLTARAFDSAGYPDLLGRYHHADGFNPETSCAGCRQYRRIAPRESWQSVLWYCTSLPCFEQKDSDHRAQIEAEKKARADERDAERRRLDAERRKAAAEPAAQPTNDNPPDPDNPSANDHGTGNPVDDAIAAARASAAEPDQTTPRPAEQAIEQAIEQATDQASPPDEHASAPDQDDNHLTDQQRRLRDGRIEKTARYLDDWLRSQLREHLADDEATRYSILLWVAAGAPGLTVNGGYYSTQGVEILLGDDDAIDTGIDYTLRQIRPHQSTLDKIIDQTIDQLDRRNLRRLARYCGIGLDGNYQIDRDYLAIKSNLELIESTPERVRARFDDWSRETRRPAGELIDRLLARADAWGIPDDLRAMYSTNA